MKKVIVFAIILSWTVLDDAMATGWRGGGSFSGGVLFSRSFVDEKVVFGGTGIFLHFHGFCPYHPCYGCIPKRQYNQYGSFYPAEIKEAGRLTIQGIPEDLTLFLNGAPLQKKELPVNIGLLVGKYKIRAGKEGYKTYEKEIEIKTAQTTHLKIFLEKEESPWGRN
jgi:hypothetical protein